MTQLLEKKQSVANKRLNISLSDRTYSDLSQTSQETKRSLTELVRMGIALLKVALEAERDGHRIIVASSDGKALKEIILAG